MERLFALLLLVSACYVMFLILSGTMPVQEGLIVVVSLAVASTLVVLASAERERRSSVRVAYQGGLSEVVEQSEHAAAILLKLTLAIELTGFAIVLLLHLLAVL